MGIKSKVIEKAETLTDHVAIKYQSDYVKEVMEMEKVDYDTAWAICQGFTDPKEYGHMLAFKMHPIICAAIYDQRSKARRKQAAENFAKTLCEEEKKLFYGFFFNPETCKRFKDEKKKEKQRQKGKVKE